MKRTGNIYQKITELSNIEAAIYKASKGKSGRNSVEKILDSPTYYALQIQKSLKDKTYRPSPYVEMKIHDGANKKERIIYKPCFYPDQIVHWALMLQIEPLLMKGMYEFCCASVKGRGIMRGMRHIKKILVQDRKYTKYCLKLDIKKFYPSIDKQILKNKFRRILKDKDTLNLIDHMVLFSNNKKELRKIKIEIDNFLSKEKLTIKENWQLFKTESRPLDFLGYRFYHGYTTLRRSNFLRIKRRAKKMSKKDHITFHDAAAMLSYSGWLKHCNSYNYQQKYIKPYVNYKLCKEVIRNESKKDRKHNKTT